MFRADYQIILHLWLRDKDHDAELPEAQHIQKTLQAQRACFQGHTSLSFVFICACEHTIIPKTSVSILKLHLSVVTVSIDLSDLSPSVYETSSSNDLPISTVDIGNCGFYVR
jgi:hypothetical protein